MKTTTKKLIIDQKTATIPDSQGQKQRDSNGRLVLKPEMCMTPDSVPQRLFSLLEVQKQEVPECLAIWYPACPSEEGALGGQLVAVTLAKGLISGSETLERACLQSAAFCVPRFSLPGLTLRALCKVSVQDLFW